MSKLKERIEWTGNIQVRYEARNQIQAENPQPCNAPCGRPEPCWGCD